MPRSRKLNAPALLERFLREVVTSSYDGSENAALLASVNVLGDTQAAAVLSGLVSAQMPKRPNECTELLLALSENPSLCFPKAAEAAVAGLDLIGTHDPEPETFDWEPEERQRPLGPQFLENLLRALQRFKGRTLCGTAAEKIASRPEIFSPVTLVVPAIERICAGRRQMTAAVDSSLRHLWTSAAEFLLQRSEVPPQPPSDWRLNVELSCSCPDCRELQSFARDPAERVHRFRVKKERRRHLHNMIDRHRLDMTHVTERVGSPQTLVCTKDRRTFDRRMKQYHDEIAAMRTLVKLAPKARRRRALCKRMQVAVKRAGQQLRGTMPRLRFSTSTLAGEEFVPWLASAGELAYSPHSPPERDYYFQYSWVIPGIFRAGTSVRRHFWFGSPFKDSPEVKLLFAFWNRARQGELDALYLANGMAGLEDVTAPLAVYRHSEVFLLRENVSS